jgi:small ligand-binding sensory domain FIST
MSEPRTATGLRFSAALSAKPDTAEAIDDVCRRAVSELGQHADLALVFVSPHHGPDFGALAASISQQTRTAALIGATGESIVGTGNELEGRPAIALWLAHLPGVTVRPMHLELRETPEGVTFTGWPDDLPAEWPAGSALLTLGDPFSFPVHEFLQRINDDHPGVPVVGGMASGGQGPGENRLLFGAGEVERGAVAALLSGPVRIRTVVSQGCRPIGRHFVVTRARQNVIQELGGKPPLEQLQELFATLSPGEQELVRRGLHVGRAITEYRDNFGRGDFLVRNVIGADPGSGSIAIGDLVRPGQTVQFHVRDAETAHEDLELLLARSSSSPDFAPLAALLFTCNGRGTRLFSQPHHDAGLLKAQWGDIPVAGFFAQGELGPISGKNFIHGFTASVALFEPGDERPV